MPKRYFVEVDYATKVLLKRISKREGFHNSKEAIRQIVYGFERLNSEEGL